MAYPVGECRAVARVLDHPAAGDVNACSSVPGLKGRRTGVLAALIHLLAETPAEAINRDYLLTRVGVEPFRNMILAGSGVVIQEHPGMLNLLSVRPGTMAAVIAAIDEKFGGVKGYLMKELGFSAEDVAIIAANLKTTP